MGVMTPLKDELLAILFGQQFARGLGIQRVFVETNSLEAFNLVHSQANGDAELSTITQRCKVAGWGLECKFTARA